MAGPLGERIACSAPLCSTAPSDRAAGQVYVETVPFAGRRKSAMVIPLDAGRTGIHKDEGHSRRRYTVGAIACAHTNPHQGRSSGSLTGGRTPNSPCISSNPVSNHSSPIVMCGPAVHTKNPRARRFAGNSSIITPRHKHTQAAEGYRTFRNIKLRRGSKIGRGHGRSPGIVKNA
jgi:hypothetical protein